MYVEIVKYNIGEKASTGPGKKDWRVDSGWTPMWFRLWSSE